MSSKSSTLSSFSNPDGPHTDNRQESISFFVGLELQCLHTSATPELRQNSRLLPRRLKKGAGKQGMVKVRRVAFPFQHFAIFLLSSTFFYFTMQDFVYWLPPVNPFPSTSLLHCYTPISYPPISNAIYPLLITSYRMNLTISHCFLFIGLPVLFACYALIPRSHGHTFVFTIKRISARQTQRETHLFASSITTCSTRGRYHQQPAPHTSATSRPTSSIMRGYVLPTSMSVFSS